MIAKMRKLNLAAMRYDKDAILDALQKTRAAEITLHEEAENTTIPAKDDAALLSRASDVESALSSLTKEAEDYQRDHSLKTNLLKDGFDVSYSRFMAMKDCGEKADSILRENGRLTAEKAALKAEYAAAEREEKIAGIYAFLNVPFAQFRGTKKAEISLGAIPAAKEEDFLAIAKKEENDTYFAFEKLGGTENFAVYAVAYLKSEKEKAEAILSSASFSYCPYTAQKTEDAETGKSLYERTLQKKEETEKALKKNAEEFYALAKEIPFLKTYSDYLAYEIEKENASDDMRVTERAFLLEAYVPEEMTETVRAALEETTGACYYDFSEPTEEDNPPTLLKNDKIVRNFEDITNMYSVPNSREFDPNTVMGFFYALFMGFIIGDMGYGLAMMIGGGLLWYKNRARESGMKRLSAVFAFGGVFAMIWGVLFNSLLGLQVLPFTVMPDMQSDMWSLAGVNVPSVLVISMEIGVAQIFVGYICRAVQCWRRGDVWGGIFDGVVWAIFSVGVCLAIIGFIEESNLPALRKIGGITAGVSLLVAMLTAGRKEKFFGKLTKGFGAAYGVINYASDILSYARLYGLLLSGAVIANIVSSYAMGFITGGNAIVAVLGVLLMIAGHIFNLAMSLLGAYIHDARLQYVEFFGRFFEGEGELFTPLGSTQKYVYLLPATAAEKAAAAAA